MTNIGCLITVNSQFTVIARKPCWPWPAPDEYPIRKPSGEWVYFFPCSYHRFRLGDTLAIQDEIIYAQEIPNA